MTFSGFIKKQYAEVTDERSSNREHLLFAFWIDSLRTSMTPNSIW
jgi:hypothetical protein